MISVKLGFRSLAMNFESGEHHILIGCRLSSRYHDQKGGSIKDSLQGSEVSTVV